jgi:hypothetical protein
MTLTLADHLATLAFAAIGGGLGAYLTAYLRIKGENFAKQEDLLKLVEQTKALAGATESMRANVSGKLWVTQERWKQKMDLYVTALTLLDDMARAWEARRDGRTPEGASVGKSLGDEMQKMMVLAQIVNPGFIAILKPLEAAGSNPSAGGDHAASVAAHAAMYRKLYHAIAAEARRDLDFAGLDQPSPGPVSPARG